MDIISKYFPHLDQDQINRIHKLETLYQYWNQKINVISRKDTGNIMVHHILHCLAIAKIIDFPRGAVVLDVGTGGGLPGLPLAIIFPDVRFHLVDSIAKKIKVVNSIAGDLGIQNVTTGHERIEKIKDRYPYIISRAVTNFPDFISLVKSKFDIKHDDFKQKGLYYLKGGDFDHEIAPYKQRVTLFNIADYYAEEFFITKKIIYYNPLTDPF